MDEGLVCFPPDKRGAAGRAGVVGSASLNDFRGHRGMGLSPATWSLALG